MTLIQLIPTQTACMSFDHPAYEGCRKYGLADLDMLAEARFAGAEPEQLILALRSISRYIVGRFLYHWPISRRFRDEMVGEAMLALTILVNNLTREELESRPVAQVAAIRVRHRIEVMLNSMQSVSAPSIRTQENRQSAGLDPIYLRIERNPLPEDKAAPDSETTKHDVLEAVAKLRTDCDISVAILDPINWGLTDTELAEKLGIYRMRVTRRRENLLFQYRELIGETK